MPSNKKWSELTPNDAWEIFLTEGTDGFARIAPLGIKLAKGAESIIFKAIPRDPRCVACDAPFSGFGAPFMRMIGRERSNYNPSICADCENMALKHRARAEVPLTMLFADIRGSTSMAEKMDPEEFSSLIIRFYQVAGDILVKLKALVDKFIGDEVSAYFVPGHAGKEHARVALEAGKEILRATGNTRDGNPWVPVGVGIHSGPAVVGALGKEGGLNEITVFGDTANTAARLASQAKAGEIIASEETVTQARIDTSGLVKDELVLKGKSSPFTAWHLSA